MMVKKSRKVWPLVREGLLIVLTLLAIIVFFLLLGMVVAIIGY